MVTYCNVFVVVELETKQQKINVTFDVTHARSCRSVSRFSY